ncbi:DUF572-domain-containing protein [Nadsonia fulvescens var. elongata DSM 6958]|uniref:Splicing factor YJU2 n=1 Tax=Nadsonia fulvescens var. elongata DSM 6958 TaxID=857566 RepID=A0A1E3PPP1_9ASCO|nr:DUF572-domain-containing protein [Nadsonia fulvescens var. elongata DSM 6958]
MSERKALQKHYPPDFDPSKIKRSKKKPAKSASATLQTVRLMLPKSIRCTTCGEYMSVSSKFNARKENIIEDNDKSEGYLGIKRYRFYIRCRRCASEIRFRTDPKTAGYIIEYGAKSLHEDIESKREVDETLEDRLNRLEQEQKEMEEQDRDGNPLGVSATTRGYGKDALEELESKVQDAQREEAMQDQIDALRTRNARIETAISQGNLLDRVHSSIQSAPLDDDEETRLQQEDELLARAVFRDSNGQRIKRLTMDNSLDLKTPMNTNMLVNNSQTTSAPDSAPLLSSPKSIPSSRMRSDHSVLGISQSGSNGIVKPIVNAKSTINSLGIVTKKKPKTKFKSLV